MMAGVAPLAATLPPPAQPMPQARTSGAPADPARMMQAARDFEAMTLGEMLQPMFNTVDTAHALFGGGAGESAFRPMLVQEMAKAIAAQGGLGLAQPIYAAMLRMQEARKP